ncbi:hypothetical protein SCHPADRAFT_948150 [Schizopora paradoxa]|uniref:Uncharacterized protein n=1 Tax=Schizopora paradoxa TaxID=27342 RepID=A0A0H2QYD3_9AGAM|nr:hypothetical protein SCHPADRAFT_948150 [Schizopora paradoxa]
MAHSRLKTRAEAQRKLKEAGLIDEIEELKKKLVVPKKKRVRKAHATSHAPRRSTRNTSKPVDDDSEQESSGNEKAPSIDGHASSTPNSPVVEPSNSPIVNPVRHPSTSPVVGPASLPSNTLSEDLSKEQSTSPSHRTPRVYSPHGDHTDGSSPARIHSSDMEVDPPQPQAKTRKAVEVSPPIPVNFPIPVPDKLEVRARIENAPEWLVDAFKSHFSELSRNNAPWARMMAFWAKHEQMYKFPSSTIKSTHLSKHQRPEEVSAFIKYGRTFEDGVWNVDDPDAFRDAFVAFWLDKQPPWRVVPGNVWPPPKDNSSDEDWEKLAGKTGENGLYTIVIALYLWSQALSPPELLGGDWLNAVNDVAWVFARLIQMGPREAPAPPSSKRAPTSRRAPTSKRGPSSKRNAPDDEAEATSATPRKSPRATKKARKDA